MKIFKQRYTITPDGSRINPKHYFYDDSEYKTIAEMVNYCGLTVK